MCDTGADKMTSQDKQAIAQLKAFSDPAWNTLLDELVPRYRRLFSKVSKDEDTVNLFIAEAINLLMVALEKIP